VSSLPVSAGTLSPTSNVAGNKFERFVQNFLENVDYSKAVADREYTIQALRRCMVTVFIIEFFIDTA
jgi:hypothetical protein